ncbi:TetR/AcrR family transcriptional regulator [Sphingopyxis indica]|uniref:Transcriptional regulator, TetR family n=1 Tax=Sphingopyxis indica TaxID=436663 RepID=A0A239HD02_9SPHN|nr:TetR/AcrR family transcriptional regulator [Sphingopyxis indica]SNS79162.1 transcriptional regulator, TetR family [Sphingopyxis indica]
MARPKLKDADKNRQSTRERLLDTAGALLAEVGMDRISTNMICERAGVTPPALYYYFGDKYEVIAALGERLMDRQNHVLTSWLAQHAPGGLAAYMDNFRELLRQSIEVTEREAGGVWIERALHATPRLEHVRLESHNYATERLVEAYAPLIPGRSREEIWQHMRMMVEFGYAAMEMSNAGTGMTRDAILDHTASMLKTATAQLIDGS